MELDDLIIAPRSGKPVTWTMERARGYKKADCVLFSHFGLSQDIRQAIENAGKIHILPFLEMSRN